MSTQNIKAKRNFLDPGWPNYMVNQHTNKYKPVVNKYIKDYKTVNVNRKFGTSADNKDAHDACPTGSGSHIYNNSQSIFGLNPNYKVKP